MNPTPVVNMLLRLYTFYADADARTANTNGNKYKALDPEAARMNGGPHGSGMNGSASMNGHARHPADITDRERQQLRDAEEFELEGLMSDDDEDMGKRGHG